MLEGKVLRGKFKGYFFTEQDLPLLSGQILPDSKKFVVHLYSGELKDSEILSEYNPETYLESDGLLLHNIKNISVERSAAAKIRESITLGFVQVVLRDVEVIRSWEKDNKTYGILTADFIGKVENKKIIHNDNKIIHNDDKIIHNDDGGGNNHIVPPHNDGNGDNGNNLHIHDNFPPFRRGGCLPGSSIFSSFSNGGCLHRIWEILKWILLFALILWLLDQCQGCNTGNRTENNCCDENQKLKEQVDSLKRRSEKLAREKKELEDDTEKIKREKENSDAKVDSLTEENRVLKQKKKFGDFNEELYFFGDSDELREYSEREVNKIVSILNKNPNLKIKIEGYVNGNDAKFPNLDTKRAQRVKDLMISKGISPDRIQAEGKGNKPVVDTETYVKDENGQRYNRNMRAIIRIIE